VGVVRPHPGEGGGGGGGQLGADGGPGRLHGRLDPDQGGPRSPTDPLQELEETPLELGPRYDHLHQPPGRGGGGVDGQAGAEQVEGPGPAHHRLETFDPTPGGGDGQVHLVEGETDVVGRHPEVAGDGDLTAAAQGVAVEGPEHRDGQPGHPVEEVPHPQGHGLGVGFGAHGGQILEVSTGDEHPLSCAPDGEYPGVRGGHLGEGGVELVHHRSADGVVGRRAVDGEDRGLPLAVQDHVGHGAERSVGHTVRAPGPGVEGT
jgi:hypothetical protein